MSLTSSNKAINKLNIINVKIMYSLSMVTDSENKTHIATQPTKGLEPKPSNMSQVRNRKEKNHTIKSR